MKPTIEKAADLVKEAMRLRIIAKETNDTRSELDMDLFAVFEELLNPYKLRDVRCERWQKMFARLCGYGIAGNINVK